MKRLLFALAVIAVTAAAFTYYLVATESGVNWLFRQASSFIPGELRVERIRGTLLERLEMKGLHYRDDATDVALDSLVLAWNPARLFSAKVDVKQLELAGLTVQSLKPGAPSSGKIQLPEIKLPVRVDIANFSLRNFVLKAPDGVARLNLPALSFAARFDESGLNISRLETGLEGFSARLAGSLVPAGNYPVSLTMDWTLDRPEFERLQGQGTVQGDLKRLLVVQNLTEPSAATATAELVDVLDALRWQLAVQSSGFDSQRLKPAWPHLITAFRLNASGTLADVQLKGNYRVHHPDYGEFGGLVDLIGENRQIWRLNDFRLAHTKSQASISLRGDANTGSQPPVFSLEGSWSRLAWPLQAKPEWTSRKGRFKVAGDANKQIALTMSAQVLDHPVDAEGKLRLEKDRMVLTGFRLDSVSTKVNAAGEWGETVALNWKLHASNLGEWLPGAKGRIVSQGEISGKRQAPLIRTRLSVENLAYGEYRARRLRLIASGGITPRDVLSLDLQAHGLQAGEPTLDVTLRGSGTQAEHRLSTSALINGKQRLDVALDGSWAAQQWLARLVRFDFSDPLTGNWQLVRSTTLRLAAERSELNDLCLYSGASSLCAAGLYAENARWDGRLTLSELPLALFKTLWPESLQVAGQVNALVTAQGTAANVRSGLIQIDTTPIDLAFTDAQKRTARIELDASTLDARLNEAGLQAEFLIKERRAAHGLLQGDLAVRGRLSPATIRQLPVSGRVALNLPDLSIASPWLPNIKDLKGRALGELTLAGTAGKPDIQGRIGIDRASLGISPLGIQITGVEVAASSRGGDSLRLDAKASSGQGTLVVTGTAKLDAAAGWPVMLHIEGKRFEVARIPEAAVLASPTLDIRTERQQIHVDGMVEIPEARINLSEQAKGIGGGAVKPSEDVIIIAAETPQPQAGKLRVYSRVRIVLGNKVAVRGYGFTGGLIGEITVTETPETVTRATGELETREASYAFYGVELKIEQGRIRYSNTPVTNPAIDFQATRTSGEVTAGLRATGDARTPEISLFSTPPMNQADILAYLVTGNSLDNVGSGQGNLLMNAAAAIGARQGMPLLSQLGSRLGLDEVKFGSATGQGGLGQTSLLLGKYLTPRLYVQYGLALLGAGNVLRIRYKLSQRWELQSETGSQTGADILFNLER
jgi:translocation and assembly module TamB